MKVHLPIIGKATGSSAGLIYQSYWGNTYARSFPFSFHYPDTVKQQECQATFFDIQRNWAPIYNQLKNYIMKEQRRNKNPYNTLSKAIYRIFNPYHDKIKEVYPSNFGLDPQNRIRPVTTEKEISFDHDEFNLHFNMGRPYNELSVILETVNIIIFNETKQNMMYYEDKFHAGHYYIRLKNTLDWENSNKILVYLAISANTWLGNFNRIL